MNFNIEELLKVPLWKEIELSLFNFVPYVTIRWIEDGKRRGEGHFYNGNYWKAWQIIKNRGKK